MCTFLQGRHKPPRPPRQTARISATPAPQLKTDYLPQNVVKINNTKFLETLPEIVIGSVIHKKYLFTLLRNIFRLLPVNCADMNRRSSEINLNKN
jgi:hypothetical protein